MRYAHHSESLARIKLENNDDREDASTVISTISDDVSEVRRLRTMDINEYLTDERAQEVIEKVSRVLEQEDDIHARQEILRRICDTIGAAQEGLDLAFAAGTLATTACIAREDSIRYKEKYSKDEVAKAMGDAKAGLKRALGIANNLEKEKFKILRHWLKSDEDVSANTVMFFERMRKEIKRSLKVTTDTIKHPGSLGARRRDNGTTQMYPSLPATIEITEEDKTQMWVNDTSKITNHANKTKANRTPPDYDTSEDSQRDGNQLNNSREPDRRSKRDVYRSAPPFYDGY